MLQRLAEIESNYQKYAFYYTKYLEEKVVYEEAIKQSARETVRLQDALKSVIKVIA
jgi:hypothetical protein